MLVDEELDRMTVIKMMSKKESANYFKFAFIFVVIVAFSFIAVNANANGLTVDNFEAYSIDKVASKYSRMKDMDEGEVCAMMDDLRKHWKKIQRQIEPKAKKAKIKGKKIAKKATKVAKKAVNKAAKTVAKKTETKPKPPIKKSSKK